MKSSAYAGLVGVVLQLIAVSPLLMHESAAWAAHHEGTMPIETKADHEKLAAAYEDEAKLLQQKIEQHERMNTVYQAMGGGGKLGGAQLGNHCKSIIKSYKSAIEDNLALAKYHHEMAASAQQQ